MKAFAGLLILLISCARQPAPPPVADSAATTKAVREIHGKTLRIFRGPADILGDTSKNRRDRPLAKQLKGQSGMNGRSGRP